MFVVCVCVSSFGVCCLMCVVCWLLFSFYVARCLLVNACRVLIVDCSCVVVCLFLVFGCCLFVGVYYFLCSVGCLLLFA